MKLFDMKKARHEAGERIEAIMRASVQENRGITDEDLRALTPLRYQMVELDDQIQAIEGKNTIRSMFPDGRVLVDGGNAPGAPGRAPGVPSETWKDARGNTVPVLTKDESYSRAVRSETKPGFGFGDFVKALVMPDGNPEMQAALSESGGIASGDVTVPTFLMPELIDLMRAKTVCVQAGALTVPIETENTDIARIAADPVPAWRSESAAVATAAPTFERVRFNPKSLAVLVQTSFELLEDSVNLNQAIQQAFAGAFAVELDRVALFGTGVAPQPHGVAGTTNVGLVDLGTNGASLTNYDPVVNAVSALLTANAALPTAAIMAPRTLTETAKLKDTLGQPMRRPDLIQNLPFLATTSVPINQTHGTASTASEIVVGDFTQLMFGIRTRLRIQILRERYLPDSGQIGFLADLRADVQLRHPQSFCEIVGVL